VTVEDICYRINEPDVTAETFEGEVIVINLANGRYHSLRGTAAWLWQALTAGLGRGEAIGRLLGASAADSDAAGQAAAFIDRLTAEELLVAAPERVGGAGADLPTPEAFIAPLIETFTDMENLLAIDPIHEVDVQGWPHTPGSA
jgi:hypothetical protein